MKYFKLFLMYVVFITIASLYGEYVVSREVNGFIQLLCSVGMVGLFIYMLYRTSALIKKEKND